MTKPHYIAVGREAVRFHIPERRLFHSINESVYSL
jgi:hypothetical protein